MWLLAAPNESWKLDLAAERSDSVRRGPCLAAEHAQCFPDLWSSNRAWMVPPLGGGEGYRSSHRARGMGHPDASLLMYSPFLDSGPEPSLNPQNRLSAAMALPGILRAPKKFFLESEYAEL